MQTKYGERPGLTVDGDREYWRGKVAECEREIVGLTHERDVARLACENLTAMRDAARAEAARLRAALVALVDVAGAELDRLDDGCAVGRYDLRDTLSACRSILRATEAGKDGAK